MGIRLDWPTSNGLMTMALWSFSTVTRDRPSEENKGDAALPSSTAGAPFVSLR
jgi:hypothetical protein